MINAASKEQYAIREFVFDCVVNRMTDIYSIYTAVTYVQHLDEPKKQI